MVNPDDRRHQEQVNLFEAFKNICFRQRILSSKMPNEDFRKTLVQLLQDASSDELDNLAIDVETDSMH